MLLAAGKRRGLGAVADSRPNCRPPCRTTDDVRRLDPIVARRRYAQRTPLDLNQQRNPTAAKPDEITHSGVSPLAAILPQMDRWQREWSGDWNGRGEPLADAIDAAKRSSSWEGARFDARLVWNLAGLSATYTDLDEARERLGYAAPPRWVTLRLYVPADISDPMKEDFLGPTQPDSDLEVTVGISQTQVTVAAAGDNPFMAQPAFEAARKVIESRAVTKVPYYLRDSAEPAMSSRWTRFVAWIEKHPVLMSLAVSVAALGVGVLGLFLGR